MYNPTIVVVIVFLFLNISTVVKLLLAGRNKIVNSIP